MVHKNSNWIVVKARRGNTGLAQMSTSTVTSSHDSLMYNKTVVKHVYLGAKVRVKTCEPRRHVVLRAISPFHANSMPYA